MARKTPPVPPNPSYLARFPAISGNTVNGHGEAERRQASCFFWHPPDRQTHGELQRFVVQNFEAAREGHPAWDVNADRGPKPIPPNPEKSPGDAAFWTESIKRSALENEADLVGIVPMDPLYVYQGYEVSEPWIVLLGVEHDHSKLIQAPSTREDLTAYGEIRHQYNRGARAAAKLGNFIRGHGYAATVHPGPMAAAVNMIPAALAAGFGELGKHGSIINRIYGSNFRISAVTTDLPLVSDRPDTFGADDFCTNCRVCSDACPPDAIHETKQLVRGEHKWYVDFDKCIPYFGEFMSCGICIAVCPWSRPGVADNLLRKMWRGRGMSGRIRVGVGGWTFEPWRGTFYPDDLPQKRELEYASRRLTSIEINGTYYSSFKPDTWAKWRDETPEDFVFAVKASRFCTNRRVLAEAGESVARFLDQGLTVLGGKLGPINWQFAGTKKFDPADFGGFLALLPQEKDGLKLRHVVEVRNPSFMCEEFYELARKHGVAIVYARDEDFPEIDQPTADFTYARLMCSQEDNPIGVTETELKDHLAHARNWAKRGDVFVYYISGAKVRNPAAAQALLKKLG